VEIADLLDARQTIQDIGNHQFVRNIANDLQFPPRCFGRKAPRELKQAETWK
jgi:hypothetical protein